MATGQLFRQWITRIEEGVGLPSDDESAKLRKTAILLIHSLNMISIVVSLASSMLLEQWVSLWVFGVFAVVGVFIIVHLFRTKRFMLFLNIWLVLSLALPFSIQVLSGGYTQANVMIWGLFSPIAAAIFLNRSQTILWTTVYILLLLASAVLDPLAQQWVEVPAQQIISTTVYNYTVAGIILLIVIRYLTTELEKSRKRSEELLLNILPLPIANRLQKKKETIADRHESVTVLFADIVGFTEMSSNEDPKSVVSMLNHLVSKFDRLTEKFELEKIKTIGDAYMVAGGLPGSTNQHALHSVEFALAMLNVVEEYRLEHKNDLQLRIGINTGPVVAGIIGEKKFAYDLWGDTVNTASRLESCGAAGKINISESTFSILNQNKQFAFVHRGPMEVKGKGQVNMYFIEQQTNNPSEIKE